MANSAVSNDYRGSKGTLKLFCRKTGMPLLAFVFALVMVGVSIIVDINFMIILFVCLSVLFGCGVLYNCYRWIKGTLQETAEEEIFPTSRNTGTTTYPEVLSVPSLANKSHELNEPPAYSKLDFPSSKSPSVEVSHRVVPLPPPAIEPLYDSVASSSTAPLYPLSGSKSFTPAVSVERGPLVPIGFKTFEIDNSPKKTYPYDLVAPAEKTPYHISGQSSIDPSAPVEGSSNHASVYTPVPSAPPIPSTSYSTPEKHP